MSINREHSDYPVYIEKCKKLWEEHLKESDGLWVPTDVLDGNTAILDAKRKYSEKLKALQKEYKYLFE